MEDTKLVELFLRRDEKALELAEAQYGRKLFGLANSILRDPQTAEECVNDALFKAWNSIPPNEPYGYLLPYLLRITRQHALTALERSGAGKRSAVVTELTREMEECLPLDYDLSDEIETKELSSEIGAFLMGLSEEKRGAFVRRYWFFDPISEISARLGCGESRVKTMLFRIRKRLAEHLRKKGYKV